MILINFAIPNDREVQLTGWEEVEFSIFKGGEPNPKLTDYQCFGLTTATQVIFKVHAKDMNDVWLLLLATDAVRRIAPRIPITLILPYVPFGRQDRVCNPGEALSLAVFAKVINDQNYHDIVLLDPHSDVTPALLENSFVRELNDYILHPDAFPGLDMSEVYLVAPDAGAQKKIKQLSTKLGAKGYICATKERDLETMEITGTKFDADVSGKKLLVVDDICDGGRTFIALAKAIREFNPEALHLWVTHGIFSYGTEIVTEHFDSVCTTNSFQYGAEGQVDASGNRDYKMTWLTI